MKSSLAVAAAAALSLCFAFAASAAPATPGPAASAAMEACRQDVQTLCAGIAPGEGRVAACLKEKRKDLSTGCKQALVKAKRSGAAKGD